MVEHDGDRLRRLLARANASQAQLAEAANVSNAAVAKWIRTGQIARDKIAVICRFVGCSSDELLGLASIEESSGAAAPRPIFTRERRASDDVMAIQIALESVTLALLRSLPDAAEGFRADMGQIATRHHFSSQHGLLGQLDDIARGVQSEKEAEDQAQRRGGSVGSTKRGSQDQAR